MNLDFTYIFYYLGVFILTLFLSRFVFSRYIGFAKRFNLVKAQSARASHKGQVFTGGGVVYAAVIMVAALVLDDLDFTYFSRLSPVLATSILVSVLGFYDDFTDISAFQKYIILTFLILMLLYSNNNIPIIQNLNGFLGIYSIGFIPGLIFTSFVYLSIMNAINLTDGIDGYLAIFSIYFFISFLRIHDINTSYTLASVSVILIASCVIFIRYNFSKGKKLFVGDAGSLFIGFWMATFLVTHITWATTSNVVQIFSIKPENMPVIAISMISVPVMDTLRVMFVRAIRKKSPFSADNNHLHHILLNNGFSHLRTSLSLTFINGVICIGIFLIEPYFNSFELTSIYILINIFWLIFFEYFNRRGKN
jgi:UDP-N-acetylmuramyl pentapeptide phosphotransferase/UDP-N-acetylglucosamine-1-phosphate transferase